MSDLDLEAIEKRAAFEARGGYDAGDAIRLREQDIPALIAEVKRLRSHVERAKMQHGWLRDFLHNEAQTAPLHVLAWDGTGEIAGEPKVTP